MPVRIGSVNVTTTSLKETVDGAQFVEHEPRRRAAATRSRCASSRASRARPPRASRCSASRCTRAPRCSARRRCTATAAGSRRRPAVSAGAPPADRQVGSGDPHRKRLWIQGMPGEDRRCVGCHESRTGQRRPRVRAEPDAAEQAQRAATSSPIADRASRVGRTASTGWNDARAAGAHREVRAAATTATTNGNGPQTFYQMSQTDPVTRRDDDLPDPALRPVGHAGHRRLRPPASRPTPRRTSRSSSPRRSRWGWEPKVTGTVPPKWGDPGQRARVGAHRRRST